MQRVSTNYSIDYSITIACGIRPDFFKPKSRSPAKLLYFHLELEFDGEISFDSERRSKLKKCLRGTIKDFGGKAETIGFGEKCVDLLIGLPPALNLFDFVERLKIFTKSIARRKLKSNEFRWNAEYEVSTVGVSQIETINRSIRQKEFALVNRASNAIG